MYTITELNHHRPKVPAKVQKRLFFGIYYYEPDDAFKFATRTFLNAVKLQEKFNGSDKEVFLEVKTEKGFRNAWEQVVQASRTHTPWVGGLFTHASKSNGGKDGLEFKPGDRSDPEDDGTLTRAEITALPRLNWSPYGYLVLTGCNTAVTGDRGWTPTEVFAKAQKVLTVGQRGYGYFSTKWGEYEEKSASDKKISLWAYKRGQNGIFGGGSRMAGAVCKP